LLTLNASLFLLLVDFLSLPGLALFDFPALLLLRGLTLLLIFRSLFLSLLPSLLAFFFSIFFLLLSLFSDSTLSVNGLACSDQHCRADNSGKSYLFDVFLFHIFPFAFNSRIF
jgi:hypothetical protein